MATTRQERKDETRARVLEAARVSFEAKGFEGTNVRDIAKACGVAPGTVLLHFADKRDLLHAALFDDLARTLAEATKTLPRGKLEHGLKLLAEAFFGYYEARPALSRALLKESLLAEGPWREKFTGQTARAHAHVVALFERARGNGEVAPEADAALFGLAFLSFFYFALIAWMQGSHPRPVALVEKLVAQHLAGLRPQERPGRKR